MEEKKEKLHIGQVVTNIDNITLLIDNANKALSSKVENVRQPLRRWRHNKTVSCLIGGGLVAEGVVALAMQGWGV